MTQLNQIIAVVNGEKKRAADQLTKLHHDAQRAENFMGLERMYTPLEDDGDQYPSESKFVQDKTHTLITGVKDALGKLWKVVATQDQANTVARADIAVNGEVLAADVPVTHMLFLEKQLVDLRTFLTKLPVLPRDEQWEWDVATGMYRSPIARTMKSKKVNRTTVAVEATEFHPAQVQAFTEDINVGVWSTTKFSGALSPSQRDEYVAKVNDVIDAVKQAREKANTLPVEGTPLNGILDYVLA